MGIDATRWKGDAYKQVIEAAVRSLAVLSNEGECKTNCWMVLVDFMHASQWQSTRLNRSIYDEMRRLGLPSNRSINDITEGITNEVASQVVKAIINHPDIKLHLTEWASNLVTVPVEFAEQNIDSLKTIALIDADFQGR